VNGGAAPAVMPVIAGTVSPKTRGKARPPRAAMGRAPAAPVRPGAGTAVRTGQSAVGGAPVFARILEAKSAVRHPAPDAARLQALAVLLEGSGAPEGARMAKELRELLEDTRLPARQKAARLKALLAEARESLAALGITVDGGAPRRAERPAADQKDAAAAALRPEAVRKPEEPRVQVVDLRRKPEERQSLDSQAVKARAAQSEPAPQPAAAGAQRITDREASLPKAARTAQSSPQSPVERLKEMAGSELTRAAGIVLRDGGGEIRLVLKPESLGSVRVRLNLTDNVIDGKIIVDNPAVKHILEGSLDSLTRALTADGFQTASLQVSVGSGSGGSQREDREVPAVRRQESVEGFAGSIPDAENAGWSDLLVNLFA
jgi:hypothetical protein